MSSECAVPAHVPHAVSGEVTSRASAMRRLRDERMSASCRSSEAVAGEIAGASADGTAPMWRA